MAKEHADFDDSTRFVSYRYSPSVAAAAVFVVAFSLTTLLHIFQIVKKRTWYFIPLAVGGVFELVGYIGHILSHSDPYKLGPFIMQSLLLLVAPALFAVSIYIILGRILLMTDGERYPLIRQRWLTKIFVAGDVLNFLVQSGGGGIQASGTASAMKTGERLILVGLFLQLFFGFFVIVGGIFHYRLARPQPISSSSAGNIDNLPWKRHLIALYVSSGLILLRSLFRIIEYVQGNAGYLLRHEIFLYIFDAVLMLVVMVIFNWIHPSQVTELYQQRLKEEREDQVELREH